MASASNSSPLASGPSKVGPYSALLSAMYTGASAAAEGGLAMYDDTARQNDSLYPDAVTHRHCADLLLPQLAQLSQQAPEGARVLDAGCGSGQLGLYLRGQARRDDLALSLVGVDTHVDLLRLAGATGVFDDLLERDLSAPFDLPEGVGPFDAAVASGVFAGDDIGPDALVHVAHHVRDGGFVVLSVRECAYNGAAAAYGSCFERARCTVVAQETEGQKANDAKRACYLVLKKAEGAS